MNNGILKKICWPKMPVHAHTRHFFGYSQEIITKISSLHSRLIFRRRLIRVYRVWSHEFLSKIKTKMNYYTRMKMYCGRSQVRSSGPAILFREDWSWNNFCGHSFPSADSNGALVNYWRKDVPLVWVNRLGSLHRKILVRLTIRLDMTIVDDSDVKPQIKQNKNLNC